MRLSNIEVNLTVSDGLEARIQAKNQVDIYEDSSQFMDSTCFYWNSLQKEV